MTLKKRRMQNAECRRKKSTLFRCAFCILHCALILLAVVPPCAAQRPQAPGGLTQLQIESMVPYGQRTDAFRRLLFELGFQPLRTFAELQDKPSESLLILLGDPRCLSKDYFPEGLRSFVEQGGAVLIATDKKTDDEVGENLRKLAGVEVTGELLVCPDPNGADLYEGSPHCPFVQPILLDGPGLKGPRNVIGTLAALVGGSRPELFRNPHSDKTALLVATNAPSYLEPTKWFRFLGGILRPGRLHRLAYLNEFVENFYVERLFAVGGTVGKGRVLVLADHSLFINRMILPRDNNNLEFAANCLHWLGGGVSTPTEALRIARSHAERGNVMFGPRNKVLFWDDGRIRGDFEVPLKTLRPKPSLYSEPALVAAIDKTIANLEDHNYFNDQLLESMDDLPGGREGVVRFAVYLLTLAALLFLGYRFLWRSRYRPELAVPILAEVVRRHQPRLSLLERRRRALLHSGNVWETVHHLAREYFESAAVSLTRDVPPRVEMRRGNWRQRWRLRRGVGRLWRLARSDAPMPISPAALQHWLGVLEEMKTALADGTMILNAECRTNHG